MERVKIKLPKQGKFNFERVEALNPDWVGRQIIVAAFLYYVLDAPCMDDAKYDRLSRFAADNWDKLDWERQWALKSPEDTRATGGHVRFTSQAAGASLNRYKYMTGISLGWHPDMVWKERKKDGCRYITCSCIKPVPMK